MHLTILEDLPGDLLDLDHSEVYKELAGPTLIQLPGKEAQPLFVSVLLHGNEGSGWQAVRNILKKYRTLPRRLFLFIGNVEAARENKRHLEDQQDYNRIWSGGNSPEAEMAKQLLSLVKQHDMFASIDLHNNTGKNPYYACINSIKGDHLNLAHLFGNTIVYFTQPDTVLSIAMSQFCPSVTVECGQSGEAEGIRAATTYIDRCLNLKKIPALPSTDISLFHTVASIKVPENLKISFDAEEKDVDLILSAGLEDYNFREIEAGTVFAHGKFKHLPFIIKNEDKKDVGPDFFELNGEDILCKKPLMPSMLSTNVEIIKQDCLCYIMERMVIK